MRATALWPQNEEIVVVPLTPPPLGQMVRRIAGFGSFLGRKHDGHPGPKAIWEGMQKVRAFALALEAGRACMPVTDKLWVIGWVKEPFS